MEAAGVPIIRYDHNDAFEGGLDDFRFYDRVMPQREVSALAGLDSDGDGLPDVWEHHWFTTSQPDPFEDPLRFSGESDPDGDLANNFVELAGGTDPLTDQIALGIESALDLYYKFDEVTGTSIADSSTAPLHNGTVSGGLGNGYFHSDDGARADVPTAAMSGLNDFNISFWARFDEVGNATILKRTSTARSQELILRFLSSETSPQPPEVPVRTGQIKLTHFGVSRTWEISDLELTRTDSWHHVVVSRDVSAKEISLTIDGEHRGAQGFGLDPFSALESSPQNGELKIGLELTESGMSVELEDFKVYSRLFTQPENDRFFADTDLDGVRDKWEFAAAAVDPSDGVHTLGDLDLTSPHPAQPSLTVAEALDAGLSDPGADSGAIESIEQALRRRFDHLEERKKTLDSNYTKKILPPLPSATVEDSIYLLNYVSFMIDQLKEEYLNIDGSILEAGNVTNYFAPLDDDSLPSIGVVNLDNYTVKLPQITSALGRMRFLLWPSSADFDTATYHFQIPATGSGATGHLTTQPALPVHKAEIHDHIVLFQNAGVSVGGLYSTGPTHSEISSRSITALRVAGQPSSTAKFTTVERRMWSPYDVRIPDEIDSLRDAAGKGYISRSGTGSLLSSQFGDFGFDYIERDGHYEYNGGFEDLGFEMTDEIQVSMFRSPNNSGCSPRNSLSNNEFLAVDLESRESQSC